MTTISIDTMSDRELLERTARVADDERQTTAELLALLGELDARRLYLGEGCSSLFTYCTQILHLSEHAAYHRIEAARAARRFPIILSLVADGSVTLTTVAMLRPHLTTENHEQVLAAARHKSKREVEHQIACLAPKPDAPALIRRLPSQSAPESTEAAPLLAPAAAEVPCGTTLVPPPRGEDSRSSSDPRPKVAPLAADRYLLRLTLSAEAHNSLRRAQELMGHRLPKGDPAAIIEKALSLLVDQLERAKAAKVRRPRARSTQRSASLSGSRHIPAAIRREVWMRDDGRCAFVGGRGRCAETTRLEFHHIIPFARGGPTSVENLSLRCRAHNSYESEQAFGPKTGRGPGPVDRAAQETCSVRTELRRSAPP